MSENPDTEMIRAVDAVSKHYDADVYVYSGPIDEEGFGQVVTAISKHKVKDKAILILTTNGGSANVAYQIARIFQKMYDEFIICAPSYCKSAGTLLALGAHRLLVDMVSDLGPLDVQLLKQNEIASRKSGLLAKSSFGALADAAFSLYETLMIGITMRSGGLVSFKLASELSASMASNLLAPVYSQINPDVVGSENRDLNVALQYGLRLIRCSDNATAQAVEKLINDYPSHDFIIDNDEVRELFKNVETPAEPLYAVVSLLRDLVYNESASSLVLGLTRPRKEKDQADENNQPANGEKGAAKAQGRGHEVDEDRPSDREGDPRAPKQRTPRRRKASGSRAKPTKGDAAIPGKPEEKGSPPLRVISGE